MEPVNGMRGENIIWSFSGDLNQGAEEVTGGLSP